MTLNGKEEVGQTSLRAFFALAEPEIAKTQTTECAPEMVRSRLAPSSSLVHLWATVRERDMCYAMGEILIFQ